MKFWEAMRAIEGGKRVYPISSMWPDSSYIDKESVVGWFGTAAAHYYLDDWQIKPERTLSFSEVMKGLKEGKKFKRLGNYRTIFAKSIKGEDERCLRTMANEDFDEDFWIISIEDIEATDWVEVP